VEKITNYEDKGFLNSFWLPEACDDWYTIVKENDTMKGLRQHSVTLGEFIEKVKPLSS
jgi:hypothetical protein